MTAPELREDALAPHPAGFALRIGLPWARALPLTCVLDLDLSVDGVALPAAQVRVAAVGRRLAVAELPTWAAHVWWGIQDRLVVLGGRALGPGPHDVTVGLRLLLPYLSAGPDAAAVLPFRCAARLTAGAPSVAATVSRDVG